MIQLNQIKLELPRKPHDLEKKVCKLLGISQEQILEIKILKKSIDARKKPLLYEILSIAVAIKQEEKIRARGKGSTLQPYTPPKYVFPKVGEEALLHRPVIVGSGPAGLFCAYELARHGYEPILLERGSDIHTRKEQVAHFWNTGDLNRQSNVQFGEGGAGTFSDGKLNTLVKDKYARNHEVLSRFVEFGGPENILYDNKPHIGTDLLIHVIGTMRKEIIKLGGSVRFQTQVTDLQIEEENGKHYITGVVLNGAEVLPTTVVVLAIGHSARDTFSMLHHHKVPMEAKSFAVGFRVEHKQAMINKSQYGVEYAEYLPPSPYKLVASNTQKERGVYSFCMCPGGYVVNASSEQGKLAINGMSYHKRDSENANSAIIVSITPDDFEGEGALAGVQYQQSLEERAYELAKGKVPVQRFGDFKKNKASKIEDFIIKPCIKGAYEASNLRSILSESCNQAFLEGMEYFGIKIPGFDQEDAILSGIESRTSSPVRIHRDAMYESEMKGLYPCGEGAGYAGGIMSAAMDGIKVAEEIGRRYAPF